ncbi:MAG: hypothetical protein LBK99_11870 [Opitutaceae bacterium]|jgi:hypothetical protein|nr:hypothetical protein [Opitutaceae bacterium]
MKTKTPRHCSIVAGLLAALLLPAYSLTADTVAWTQAGASTATSLAAPDDNMNWLVETNWSGGAAPDVGDDIVFGDVTTDLSAINGVNGRYVVFRNTGFAGSGSLALEQTTAGFVSNIQIRHDGTGNQTLKTTFGAVTISSGAQLAYYAQARNDGDASWRRQFAIGTDSTVLNNGTLSASFDGNSSNRNVVGSLSIAAGGAFTNAGALTVSTGGGSQYAGYARYNVLVGDTVNTGAITLNRNGSSVKAIDAYGAARGGNEFASLHNSGAASRFTFNASNAVLLSTDIADLDVADRAANLVIVGALLNDGAFAINRTPLKSKTGNNGATDNDSADAQSRAVTARFGSFGNNATGSFVVNHNNAATALVTTASTVEITTTGAATNAGWLSLKGAATATDGADGAILTRFVTAGGFANTDGGIVTVDGKAVLANTGDFSNTNTQASRTIQGAARTWDTRGLRLENTTDADAVLTWATGVSIDPDTLSAATFSAGNFTIGDLIFSTGAAACTLAGGGDLLIAGDFRLTGALDLGDWSSVTSEGGKGQTLLFADTTLKSYVGSLLSGGDITATLADGYALAVFANPDNEAFYIGVTAVPEPAAYAALAGLALLAWVALRRYRGVRG